jgi:hypothetical protein
LSLSFLGGSDLFVDVVGSIKARSGSFVFSVVRVWVDGGWVGKGSLMVSIVKDIGLLWPVFI